MHNKLSASPHYRLSLKALCGETATAFTLQAFYEGERVMQAKLFVKPKLMRQVTLVSR
jgi:hypothetical protein